MLKVQKLVEEIIAYITTNSDDNNKELKIKRKEIDCLEQSATEESAVGSQGYHSG